MGHHTEIIKLMEEEIDKLEKELKDQNKKNIEDFLHDIVHYDIDYIYEKWKEKLQKL